MIGISGAVLVAPLAPEHILSCLRLSRETFETDPLLALDFLRFSCSHIFGQRVPEPTTITAAEPVGWTWDQSDRQAYSLHLTDFIQNLVEMYNFGTKTTYQISST
ncbi:hypothetical protein AVEN_63461-1 [Araneus ventricosus]|uniref:Uncharacterized protein n=1 Tax=Araneus ventricosus TaxID=182803 RepID=A0A4Y2CUR8_ARAVE|nr:hypothetical protein AVEN_63461-1 [Araneus ventricosus]